ncbi:MAG: glycosyltransferase [Anaerolineales bacterium]|nr:glycosyltransferase [Anaerolineales bacterium]
MFEAAAAGLPILTINWGGQKDFLSVPNKKGKLEPMATFVSHEVKPVQKEAVWDKIIIPESEWAYPASWDYKVKMRSVFKAYGEKKAMAKKLAEYNRERFGGQKQYKKMAEAILGEAVFDYKDVDVSSLPKISVITSVFKAREYIEEFLKDVERQTIFKEKVELVLVDPGSPEQEEEVIKVWVEKYPDNIKYIKLESDPGLYACWNQAIQASTGEFISNWNCDDRRAPDALEKMAKQLVSNPSVEMVYFDYFMTNKPNETFEANSSNGNKYNMDQFSKEALLRMNLPHCGPMWRKSAHDRVGFFNEDYKSASDWEWNLRLAFSGGMMKKMSEPLGLYYFSPRGISTDPKNNSWKRKEEREIFNRFNEMLKKEKEPQQAEVPVNVIL